MPNMNNLTEMPRKDLHVFYVLDTSGSMAGQKIQTLNSAMRQTTDALVEVAKKNGDAKLKIAVLEFNSGCRWITDHGPEAVEDFVYEDLSADGGTNLALALNELNSKLSRHAFLDSMAGAFMPVIIFMTDGYTSSYTNELEEIRKNPWFRRATKIGFALGDGADVKMVASVVGNSEAVIQTDDMELFKKLIRFVSVTASMLVSQSATTNTTYTGADIVQRAEVPKDATVNLSKAEYSPEPEAPTNDADWDNDANW